MTPINTDVQFIVPTVVNMIKSLGNEMAFLPNSTLIFYYKKEIN